MSKQFISAATAELEIHYDYLGRVMSALRDAYYELLMIKDDASTAEQAEVADKAMEAINGRVKEVDMQLQTVWETITLMLDAQEAK